MKMVLKKPLAYMAVEKTKDGEAEKECTISEINLDFDALTGKDLLEAHKEAKKSGYGVEAVAALSPAFQAAVVSRATRVPVETILRMNAQDFTTATLEAQNFLFGGDTKE